MKTFRRLGLAVGLALLLGACGGGGGSDSPAGTRDCVWDSSNWDDCNWSA